MALDKAKLAEMMNEQEFVRPAATPLPIISLEGNKGVFMKKPVDGDKVELGQTFSGVIVGVRQVLSNYQPKSIKNTPEYSKPNTDRVPLFEKKGKTEKGMKIDENTPVALKAKYPELRTQVYLYMLVSDEMVKVKIKGAGMTHWFDFLKELSKKKLHTFQVKVKIDPAFEKNEELGNDYYATVLTIEKELTDEQIETMVAPKIGEFAEEFAKLAEYAATKKETVEPVVAEEADELPEDFADVEGEEEKGEDRPF